MRPLGWYTVDWWYATNSCPISVTPRKLFSLDFILILPSSMTWWAKDDPIVLPKGNADHWSKMRVRVSTCIPDSNICQKLILVTCITAGVPLAGVTFWPRSSFQGVFFIKILQSRVYLSTESVFWCPQPNVCFWRKTLKIGSLGQYFELNVLVCF